MAALNSSTEILEDLFVKDSNLVGIKNLADILGIESKVVCRSLKIRDKDEVVDPSDKNVKKWIKIFNLVLEIIKQGEPDITKQKACLKLKRWFHMPQIQLQNETPLDFMLKGKTKQLICFLEQLSV